MNTKEIIIKGISDMNSELLLDVLDDNLTYQEAHKEVFIQKLEEAFGRFRKVNDTFLIPEPGACMYDQCTNKGCKGYSFIGNNSGTCLDLIIEEKGDQITDIFYCRGMETKLESTMYTYKIRIHIGTDEEADFHPTTEYLYNVQKSDKAIEEIESQENLCFSKLDIIYLVEKYNSLYNAIFNPFRGYTRFEKFESAFEALKEISNYIGKEDKVKKALSIYNEETVLNDNELLRWLLKVEDLGLEMGSLIFYMDIDALNNQKTESINFNNKSGIKIYKQEFESEIKFCQLFNTQYSNFIDKHSC